METAESSLVTADGTKVLTVEEFGKLKTQYIRQLTKAMFELNAIAGLRYV